MRRFVRSTIMQARPGYMPQEKFLHMMREAGFSVLPESQPPQFVFAHPKTGTTWHLMKDRESFRKAYDRLTAAIN